MKIISYETFQIQRIQKLIHCAKQTRMEEPTARLEDVHWGKAQLAER
jgi:hypothetical protein